MKKLSYNKVDSAAIRRLTEISGPKAVFNNEEMLDKYSRDETIGLSYNPEIVILPATRSDIERMWEGRKCLFEAANNDEGMYKSLDVVVPRSLIPALISKIQKISEKYNIKAMNFGHAGDGNIHVLLFKGTLKDEKWEKDIELAQEELYRETIILGGRITAEHGIGLLRKNFLTLNLGSNQVDVLKNLKRAFDPNFILNPGKIFDLI